jgi:PKD repeat protein/Tol biopolymer transport system component
MSSRIRIVPALLPILTFLAAIPGQGAAPPCRSTATTLVSTAAAGNSGNDASGQQDISADGRYVAFRSRATDIVTPPVNMAGNANVFLRDRSNNSVRALDTAAPGQGFSDTVQTLALSADGQRIAFDTLASNIVAGDTNGHIDVYVKDFRTNSFLRATVPDSSIFETQESKHHAGAYSLNEDGHLVAFTSSGKVFSREYFEFPEPTTSFFFHVYVRDTANHRTYLVTRGVNAQGQSAALDGKVGRPALTANGQLLAFSSDASNLVNFPNPTHHRDVYIGAFNSVTGSWGVTEKIPTGTLGINSARADDVSISPDGRYVAYVTSEPNATGELYVYDRTSHVTVRPRPGGARPDVTSAAAPHLGYDTVVWQDIDLTGEGSVGAYWAHLPDLLLQRVGREATGAPACCGSHGNTGEPGGVAVSADGRWATFHSASPGIATPDDNFNYDTFVQRMTAVADFTFVCNSLTCSFDAAPTLSACTVSSYAWTFGDAATGSGITTVHTYLTGGQRPVTLTVTDINGARSSVTKLVTAVADPPAAATRFVAIRPCRLFDSRTSGKRIGSGEELVLDVEVPLEGCTPNRNARVASITVTAVGPDTGGSVAAYAPDSPPLTATTALDLTPATAPRANNLLVPVTKDGTIALKPALVSGALDLVVDLNGYFTDNAGIGVLPLGFQPLAPCRVYDSRSGAPYLRAEVRNVPVQGLCGIPAGPVAASLNATVVSPTAAGSVKLFLPDEPKVPLPTNLEFPVLSAGALANGARIALQTLTPNLGTQMALNATGTAHLVLDTNGYYKQDAPLQYTSVTPCRALDTRLAVQGPALRGGETRRLQIRGNCGVPADARVAMVNVTVAGATAASHLIAFASGTTAPTLSTIEFQAGETALGNGTTVPLSQTVANDLSLTAFDTTDTVNRTDVLVDVFGYFR